MIYRLQIRDALEFPGNPSMTLLTIGLRADKEVEKLKKQIELEREQFSIAIEKMDGIVEQLRKESGHIEVNKLDVI